MRALIVGGTGNISSAVVPLLVEEGHEVTVLSRGQRTSTLPPEVLHVTLDRQDRSVFEEHLRHGAYDAVIDQICYTRDDAECAIRGAEGNVGHYIFTSTVCAIGVHVTRLPTPEDEPYRPVSDYGRGKQAAEETYLEAFRDRGFPITIFRPSTTYGRIPLPRQLGFDRTFVDRLRKGLPIVVTDDAERLQWQMLDRRDAAVAYLHALGRTATLGNIYNLVGDEVMSWATLHREVAAAIGAPPPDLVPLPIATISAAPGRDLEVLEKITAFHGWYDASALNRDIPEFRQRIPFQQGAAENVAWMDTTEYNRAATTDDWEDALVSATRSTSPER